MRTPIHFASSLEEKKEKRKGKRKKRVGWVNYLVGIGKG
jgi:hypothetical protein